MHMFVRVLYRNVASLFLPRTGTHSWSGKIPANIDVPTEK